MDFLFPFHHHGQGIISCIAASSDQLDQPSSRKQSIVDFHMGSCATCAPPLVGCRKNGAPRWKSSESGWRKMESMISDRTNLECQDIEKGFLAPRPTVFCNNILGSFHQDRVNGIKNLPPQTDMQNQVKNMDLAGQVILVITKHTGYPCTTACWNVSK